MNISLFLILTYSFSAVSAEPEDHFKFFTEYFSTLEVGSVTFFSCKDEGGNFKLSKRFSIEGITYNWINLDNKYDEVLVLRQIEAKYHKQGIVVDLKCPYSMEVLQTASENYFFFFHRSLTFWLILYPATLPKNILEKLIEDYVPRTKDLNKFLMEPYPETNRQNFLLEINKKENEEVLRNYEEETFKPIQTTTNETVFSAFLDLNILLNSKVIIAVPAFNRETSYFLYHVYKTTRESRPTLEEVGNSRLARKNNYNKILRVFTEKKNLNNEILKGASVVFSPENFTAVDDTANKEQDIWVKISYPHVKLLSEDLNFRFVLRYFDKVGYSMNGTVKHLMGLFKSNRIDISGTALLMRPVRTEFLSFLVCPYSVEVGLLFIEPPLPSVTNVFVLPFAKSIWISYGGIILLTTVIMKLRSVFSESVFPLKHCLKLSEVGNYVLGSVCQQSLWNTPTSLSDRIAIISLLLISVSLLSAYSACIVTLMQASSSAISSLEDMTRSDFEVGIQKNFPYFEVAMQEAIHPVEKEYYKAKLLKKDKKKIFFNRNEGMEKVRTGLFAFEVEFYPAYKYISRTYEEHEKCGLKTLDVIKNSPFCFFSFKNSPYKEIFAQRYLLQFEAGLFDRTRWVWTEKKPKCEGSRLGFISIGVKEFRHIMLAFIYGIMATLVIFLAELLFKKKISRDFRNDFRRFPKF